MLIDSRHWLPPDLGRPKPRPRLLLFILPRLMRETTIIVAPFRILCPERSQDLESGSGDESETESSTIAL